MRREANVPRSALVDQFLDRLDAAALAERPIEKLHVVDAVQRQQINVIQLQVLHRLVESLEELKILQARAEEFRSRDDRMEILPYEVEDHTVLKLHNFYVRYLLPLSIEVQYFELTPG